MPDKKLDLGKVGELNSGSLPMPVYIREVRALVAAHRGTYIYIDIRVVVIKSHSWNREKSHTYGHKKGSIFAQWPNNKSGLSYKS